MVTGWRVGGDVVGVVVKGGTYLTFGYQTCLSLFLDVGISVMHGFLDAFSHLYKRMCPFVSLSVHPSVSHT